MPDVQIGGTLISYSVLGSGPPLLLIHAFPLSAAMWRRQAEGLAGRFQLILPDTRGLGASGLGDEPVTIDRYADDVAALLDHLGLASAAIGGLSMGGYIALGVLRRHPQRVAALVLANTRALPDSDEARAGRETNARLVEERGAAAIADAMLPRLLAAGASDALRDEVRNLIEANRPAGIAAALRAMGARPDSSPLLGTIHVPALVIASEGDAIIPASEQQAMAAAIPGARLAMLGGAGHLSNLEAPEEFNAALDALTW